MARFENLADLFDYPANASLNDTSINIDLDQFARGLYAFDNGPGAQIQNVSITEYEISGIITLEEMISKKA